MIPAQKMQDKTAIDINNIQNHCDTVNNTTEKTNEIKPEKHPTNHGLPFCHQWRL